MGEVNGTKDTYAFWAGSVDVFSVYALKTICSNCSMNGTMFELNTQTGTYDVIDEPHTHVYALLNAKVLDEDYDMYWTNDLDLEERQRPDSSASTHMLSLIVLCVMLIFTLF